MHVPRVLRDELLFTLGKTGKAGCREDGRNEGSDGDGGRDGDSDGSREVNEVRSSEAASFL